MEYRAFLETRRDLIAQIIYEGYQTLTAEAPPEAEPEEFNLEAVLDGGESEAAEFKSTLRVNLHTGNPDKRIELAVLKTLAGFLNANGGTLLVGVSDDGEPLGVEPDTFSSEDAMSLHLVNIVKTRVDSKAMAAMHVHFEENDGARVMVVRCQRSPVPVFVKD